MMTRIKTLRQYQAVMKTIEALLDKATRIGGFHKLPKEESTMLANLSRLAETYEDRGMELMPMKPKTLREAVEFKRLERKLTQADLAKALGMGAPKLSQILSGKREPDILFLKAVHRKLKIDADFLLRHA
jgi:antitoxin component HigA of HigAB toxin-antitoxin module